MSWENDYWGYINRQDNCGTSVPSRSPAQIAREAQIYADRKAGYSEETIARRTQFCDSDTYHSYFAN